MRQSQYRQPWRKEQNMRHCSLCPACHLLQVHAPTTCIKTNTGPRDQILPVSINGPTNYNFALFSKLPTNYLKKSKHIQRIIDVFRKYRRTRRILDHFLNTLLFWGSFVGSFENNENYDLQANFQKVESDLCLNTKLQQYPLTQLKLENLETAEKSPG